MFLSDGGQRTFIKTEDFILIRIVVVTCCLLYGADHTRVNDVVVIDQVQRVRALYSFWHFFSPMFTCVYFTVYLYSMQFTLLFFLLVLLELLLFLPPFFGFRRSWSQFDLSPLLNLLLCTVFGTSSFEK